jgi:hypothetical protein
MEIKGLPANLSDQEGIDAVIGGLQPFKLVRFKGG